MATNKKKLESADDGELLTKEDTRVKKPKRYWVIMHNDDYTTQDFVVYVLEQFFHKTGTEAQTLMMTVHLQGKASVGLYSKDVAETKAHHVMQYARENGMPLKLSTQPE
ncbi:MAG: ATP-dependent Clp protease adaptor ClpS [Myxococcaceae bacterium]